MALRPRARGDQFVRFELPTVHRKKGENVKMLRIFVVVFFAGAVACSPRLAGEGEAVGEAMLSIEYASLGMSRYSVYAMPTDGSRTLLSDDIVPAQPRPPMSFDVPTAGPYQFIAEGVGEPPIVSEVVTVSPGDRLSWNIFENSLTFLE